MLRNTQSRGPLPPGKGLEVAFELSQMGIETMRRNLRRRHPEADDREIDRLLDEWLAQRPHEGPELRPRRKSA